VTTIEYSEDEQDLLREIFNIAMGQSGSKLAEFLRSFVDLSVPEIQIVAADKMLDVLVADQVLAERQQLSVVRQTFYRAEQADGEAIVLFSNGPETIARVLGLDGTADREQEMEFLLELSNIVVGACLNGVSLQLFAQEMSFGAPALLAESTDLRTVTYTLFQRRMLRWNQCLLGRIHFKMEKESFSCDLLILMSERSIESVQDSLKRRLAQL
jgi:chemotaxis protein CheC